MKICLIGDYPPYKGGVSHFNFMLHKTLAARHSVTTISWKRKYPALFYPGKEQRVGNPESGNDILFILDSVNPLTWLSAAEFINKNKFDAVVFHWLTPFMGLMFFIIAKLVKKQSRIISICHNVLPHEKGFLDIFLTRLFSSKVDCFLLHSGREIADLKQIIKNPKLEVAYHPLYDMFENKKVPREIAKKKLGISGNVVLFFGYVREYKGLKDLIKCLPHVLKKINLTLLVVGEFWQGKKKYTKLIKDSNLEKNIILIDSYVPDNEVQNYFNASDLVAMPYRSATQSGSIQTAFGFDVPVVCTDVGGLGESVTDGTTGFVVPKENTQKLAEAVIRYFEERKEKEFVANIKRTKERFSWKNYAALLEKCIS